MPEDHQDHQNFERSYWGDCANTWGEEQKQLVAARLIGLTALPNLGQPVFDAQGKAILDIGGGPVSLLLKTINFSHATVVDPCEYPEWCAARYAHHGIEYVRETGEAFQPGAKVWDEVWMYNVLQHVVDPKQVIETAKRCAPVIRIFDWVEIPATIGHPHVLHASELDEWLETTGSTQFLNEDGCYGPSYAAVANTRWHL